MAGTKAYVLETPFDPREMTLGEFIDFYAKESTEKGNRKNQDWANKIRKNPVYKDFLDEPVINVLDSTATIGEDTIYQAAENAEEADSAKATLQSRMRVLEDNVLKRVEFIQAQEGVDLSKYISLTKATPRRATRGKQATLKTQFDSNKMGQLVKNLEDHVAKFPEDRPKANAILLLLELGSRPSLPLEIISSDYQTTKVTEEAEMLGSGIKSDGLNIPAGRKGVKRQAGGQTPNVQPYNSPLSQRAITILQDQSDYNRTNFGESRLDFFFQMKDGDGNLRPLDLTKDINPLLKIVTPPGTVQKLRDGKFVATDDPLTAKNFRTIWSNIAFNALDDAKKVSYLQSRDVGTNTGSVSVYLGQVGDYKPAAVDDLNKISMKTWGLYSLIDDEGKDQFKNSGNLLSTSTMLFGDNIYRRKERIYEPFGSGVAQNIPIQTGGFSAPVDETAQKTKVPAAKSADPDPMISESGQKALNKYGLGDLFKNVDKGKAGIAAVITTGIASSKDAGAAALEFLGESGRDLAIEGALLAAKAPTAVAGAATFAVDPSLGVGISPSTIRPEEDDMTRTFTPLSDESMMEDIAIRDSAMRLKPEAGKNFIPAPEVENDNFLTMKP